MRDFLTHPLAIMLLVLVCLVGLDWWLPPVTASSPAEAAHLQRTAKLAVACSEAREARRDLEAHGKLAAAKALDMEVACHGEPLLTPTEAGFLGGGLTALVLIVAACLLVPFLLFAAFTGR